MSDLAAVPSGVDLESALASLEPTQVARLVAAAPSLERKGEILWALEDAERRRVLRLIQPAVLGALIQNLEDDNRYLLGDLGVEQFRALLALCAPERQYYWVTLALSFTDVRANALPLLLPTEQLADILFTRAEWEQHLQQLADYPLDSQRLPPEMLADPAQGLVDLFGPENLLRVFPIADPNLAAFVQTILDYDADRYADLIRAGLRRRDYQESHEDEWTELTEAPVLLTHLDPPSVMAGAPTPKAAPDEAEEPEAPPLALVPVAASPLARRAAALTPAARDRLAGDLQELFVRQAIAEGGSFLMSDLQRVAASVQAYVLLGLRAESGDDPAREPAVLGTRPLHKVAQSGARVVEALRQVALRLAPLRAVLDGSQRAVIAGITRPRLTLTPEGEPRLVLPPAPDLPDNLPLEAAGELLADIAAWAELARALGLTRVEAALREARMTDRLLEEAALAAVLFGKVGLGVTEPGDRERFRREHAREGAPTPAARAALRRALAALPGGGAALRLLESALERVARG